METKTGLRGYVGHQIGNCQGQKVSWIGWVWEVMVMGMQCCKEVVRLCYAPGLTGSLGLATLRVRFLTNAAEGLGPLRCRPRR
jgi:hypothetical protein